METTFYAADLARAQAVLCDDERAAARRDYEAASAAAKTAPDARAQALISGFADLFACRARRAGQWADNWRLLAEQLEDAEERTE